MQVLSDDLFANYLPNLGGKHGKEDQGGEIDMYFIQEPVDQAVEKMIPEAFKEVRARDSNLLA